MTAAPFRRLVARGFRIQRRTIVRAALAACTAVVGAIVAVPQPLAAQTLAGSAWSLPDPNDLLSQVIRRIVTQDKPGGLPVAEYPYRAFGREETAAAVRAYSWRAVALTPTTFADVNEWPVAPASDTLPCSVPIVPMSAPDPFPSACRSSSALWLAVTRIEHGDLPHELHVWYATRFRTDVQGSVQSATYSFCERWLRIGGRWKYDGFVRMTQGVVTSTTVR